jgi:hypothetical protein
MDTKKDFDYKSFKQEAIASLRSGNSLSGKNGILAPLLSGSWRRDYQGSWKVTCLKRKTITVATA